MRKQRIEKWLPVTGIGYEDFTDLYQVSNFGRLRSFHKDPAGQVLDLHPNQAGYVHASLYRNGKAKGTVIHRLVLLAFRGEPTLEQKHCRHLNGIRHDNRLENLAWSTVLENAKDRAKHGTQIHGEQVHCACLTDEAVRAIRQLFKDTDGTVPQVVIAEAFETTPSSISSILCGKNRLCAGGPDCTDVPRYTGKDFDTASAHPLIDKYKQRITQIKLTPKEPKPEIVDKPDYEPIEGERWRPLPRYENLYQISDIGRVLSFHRNSCGSLLGGSLSNGYRMVVLSRKGKTRPVGVHRLVLLTFVGEPGPDQECRHLNGIRDDNRLENICWGLHRENMNDKIRHGTQPQGEQIHCSKLTEADVVAIRERVHQTAGTMSFGEIAKEFNIGGSNVGQIVRGYTWKHVDGPDCSDVPRCLGGGDRLFTETEAQQIIQEYRDGTTQKALAAKYDTTRQTIKQLVHRKLAYTDVEAPAVDQRYRKGGPKFVGRSEAEEIRQLYSTDASWTLKTLAAKYKLAFSTINYIVLGQGRYSYFDSRVEPCGRSSKSKSFDRQEAEQIRADYAVGKVSLKKLGIKYGTSINTINNIVLAKGRYGYFGCKVEVPQTRRLTDEEAKRMRELYQQAPRTFASLAKQFSVSSPTVRKVIRAQEGFAYLKRSVEFCADAQAQ